MAKTNDLVIQSKKPNPYDDFNLLGESSPKDKWVFTLLVLVMIIVVTGVYLLKQVA